MKLLIACAAAMEISSYAFSAAAALPTQIRCDPKSINQAQFADDINTTIANNQRCLDEKMAELVANEKARGGKAQTQNNLEELIVGAHLVAKVELLAQKGDLKSAAVALADAQTFDRSHEFAAMRWGLTGASLDIAEAYVLEKDGDLRGALTAYLKIANNLKEQGWSDISNVLFGRMAAVALQLGEKAKAQQWAQSALEVDPAANAVMGQIALQNGDKMGAKRHLEKSLGLMMKVDKSRSWNLPIFFSELRSVRALLAK